MKRHGFTLVELLVVIVIIAILAALLFPVFTKGKESSRQAVCISNLHQIGAAIQTYTDDYHGHLPYPSNFALYISRAGKIPDLYQPYTSLKQVLKECVKNDKIWQCPSMKLGDLVRPPQRDDKAPMPTFEEEGDCYTWNGCTPGSATYPRIIISGMLASQIKCGTRAALVWDKRQWKQGSFSGFNIGPAHGDYINVGWADGHVSKVMIAGPGFSGTGNNNFWSVSSWWGFYR